MASSSRTVHPTFESGFNEKRQETAEEDGSEHSKLFVTQDSHSWYRSFAMSLNSFALLDIDSPNPEPSKRNPSSVNLEILEERFDQENEYEGIVGNSASLREVLQLVESVATGNSTVLLLGETGTGKELVARAIHNRSMRRERAFVK